MEKEINLIRFKSENDLWGYKNDKGNIVIEPMYVEAYDFSEGFAKVKLHNSYGFIKENGETKYQIQFEDAWGVLNGSLEVKFKGRWYTIDVKTDYMKDSKIEHRDSISESSAGSNGGIEVLGYLTLEKVLDNGEEGTRVYTDKLKKEDMIFMMDVLKYDIECDNIRENTDDIRLIKHLTLKK
jgi:hypothetical protein